MFDALGQPAIDPHGDPIPTVNGEVSEAPQRALNECRAGESVHVLRVSDPEKLRVIERLGLPLETEVAVLAGSLDEGPISVSVKSRRCQIPVGLAKVVYVA